MVAFHNEQRYAKWILLLVVLSSSCYLSWANGDKVVEDAFVYVTPQIPSVAHFVESFDDIKEYKSRWVLSDAKKDDIEESLSKYNGEWNVEVALENGLMGDLGLVLKSKAKHHAIAAKLNRPFTFDKKPFIVQYEVNFQNGQDCGGAYLKLLADSKDLNLKSFHDKTPYVIMFGPDKCGNDAKLHFIFRHRNPINGSITEKHCKKPSVPIDEYYKDKRSHLYTLVLNPDNTFKIFVDNVVVNEGNLLEDFTPPVNPSSEIDDPNDVKPEDWDEREMIVDPDAKKPDDWDEDAPQHIPDPNAVKPEGWLDDEPETIPDPNAVKPNDWDEEMDGEWEPPLINNPKCETVGCGEWKPSLIENPAYKGKWYPPYINNPGYKGKWKPKKIPNPDFYEDTQPFKMVPIGAVGFELWSMSDGIYFDNLLIVDEKTLADQWAQETWAIKKRKTDAESETIVTRLMKYTNTHPWLYAVYVVVIGLPIFLVVFFCCSSEDKNRKQLAAKAKKTDEVQPDDRPLISEVAEDTSSKLSEESCADAEVPGDSDAAGDHNQDSQSEHNVTENKSDDEKEATGGGGEPSNDVSAARSPRKPRSRKE